MKDCRWFRRSTLTMHKMVTLLSTVIRVHLRSKLTKSTENAFTSFWLVIKYYSVIFFSFRISTELLQLHMFQLFFYFFSSHIWMPFIIRLARTYENISCTVTRPLKWPHWLSGPSRINLILSGTKSLARSQSALFVFLISISAASGERRYRMARKVLPCSREKMRRWYPEACSRFVVIWFICS